VNDPDPGELSRSFWIERRDGLLLDERIDLLEEGEVVGMHGVEVELGDVDELRRRRILRGRERIDAGLLYGRDATEGA
jgi:hypothetical protein